MPPKRSNPHTRFWKHVRVSSDTSECWEWTGKKGSGGYGIFAYHIDDKWTGVGAHRFAYEAINGPIGDGLRIDHLCRNRACVNPIGGHLEPVSHRENCLRGVGFAATNAAKTHCKHGHEFTPENTRLVRTRCGTTGRDCRTCHNARLRSYARRRQSALAPAHS